MKADFPTPLNSQKDASTKEGEQDLEYADSVMLECAMLDLQVHDAIVVDTEVEYDSNEEIIDPERAVTDEEDSNSIVIYPDIAETPARFADRAHLPSVAEEDESAFVDNNHDETLQRVPPDLEFGAHRGFYKTARSTSQDRELEFRHEEERIESLTERIRRYSGIESSTPRIVVFGAAEGIVEDDPESPSETVFDIGQYEEFEPHGSFINLTSDSANFSDDSDDGSGYPETLSSESTLKEETVKLKKKLDPIKGYGSLTSRRPNRRKLEIERSRQCSAEYTVSWVKRIQEQLPSDDYKPEHFHYF